MLHLLLDLFHQFEEHVCDIMARNHAFQAFLCSQLVWLGYGSFLTQILMLCMGFEEVTECPLTPLVIVFINCAICLFRLGITW